MAATSMFSERVLHCQHLNITFVYSVDDCVTHTSVTDLFARINAGFVSSVQL